MGVRRSGAGVGVLDGVLYAVGGHDGPEVRNSVEAYRPSAGVWTSVSDMQMCRRNAGNFLFVLLIQNNIIKNSFRILNFK